MEQKKKKEKMTRREWLNKKFCDYHASLIGKQIMAFLACFTYEDACRIKASMIDKISDAYNLNEHGTEEEN